MYFAPFMKQPLEVTLRGITNDPNDLSVSSNCGPGSM
jgi:hypothetical protein